MRSRPFLCCRPSSVRFVRSLGCIVVSLTTTTANNADDDDNWQQHDDNDDAPRRHHIVQSPNTDWIRWVCVFVRLSLRNLVQAIRIVWCCCCTCCTWFLVALGVESRAFWFRSLPGSVCSSFVRLWVNPCDICFDNQRERENMGLSNLLYLFLSLSLLTSSLQICRFDVFSFFSFSRSDVTGFFFLSFIIRNWNIRITNNYLWAFEHNLWTTSKQLKSNVLWFVKQGFFLQSLSSEWVF